MLPLVVGPFLFIPAGTLGWPMGWAVLLIYVTGTLALSLTAATLDPGLAEERFKSGEGAKKWDWLLTAVANFLLIAVMLPVCGFDYSLLWSHGLPALLPGLGLMVFVLGYVIIIWSMRVNPFFSAVVRIQEDRGHVVAATGPYRFVRHPGYLAMILQFLAIPLALGSLYAYIPAALAAGVYIARTALEDKTLKNELTGYQAYAERVRFRLFPKVW